MKFGHIALLLIALIMLIGCVAEPLLPAQPSVPPPEPPTAPPSEPESPDVFAAYNVEFIAEWSEKTHPDDYPGGAHFSPFVAYSHDDSSDSLIFVEGQKPTPGIELMAETGGTTTLNQEIDEIIGSNLAFKKTQGSVFNSPGIDSSELEFTDEYSYITFVSMIAPSPDWFVAQTTDLLKNGEWIDEIELDLITYDAGSDSGEMFTSPDKDTQPKKPIIVFLDDLQRLGKLVLTRIR